MLCTRTPFLSLVNMHTYNFFRPIERTYVLYTIGHSYYMFYSDKYSNIMHPKRIHSTYNKFK